ncbi:MULTISPECIES: leucyl/phenylalanyl-tRNA--protein transferase [unclassified Campylobacter]|uniref:leucyl/phenylalanyl-tRNA--protein transferase n=1 Tax=unclassified Campylobacter TaxID=2593542 RepID=UPI001237C51A|nr:MULTISPECIES: leucyl/phenylalanyl-tRNA--protein transferase [unclassified Campylobacter]KAA6225889.1 leucyl/phenylalanyl-tRNA--protein transferase [Campylobacter sp. LR185c]KAA6227584.1 leucyl/phenylalanyl-tRNA--protein transferase [Campylobacter sp. LR286c]KAA6230694.1 leucyl/phenylalanyl-tRNA--protein transferase [Campylobacter sp. LR291e]KAA8604990.1 leucyl/phenylalanyl-tRNA--protein transferase [Campylobacter sp. LR185c]
MNKSQLYSKLLNAPSDAPVFLTPNLDCDFIINAYEFGLFPWTSKPVTWWCPNPRCVLFPNQIHIQKSIKKFLNCYEFRLDYDFLSLIKLCANREKTWIDNEFIKTYNTLFKKGVAHSLELYENDKLIGGIYGLIIGKMFFGESMVSLKKNVSKIALIALCKLLKEYNFLIDCQVYNKHLEFMGAKNIDRTEFLKLLENKINSKSGFDNFRNLQTHLQNI